MQAYPARMTVLLTSTLLAIVAQLRDNGKSGAPVGPVYKIQNDWIINRKKHVVTNDRYNESR